ncbi:hypothetical protein KRX19_03060 [Cardiobacteriaceae bacterium TAE3-ERU3]|nr:hypothetical protein [Cardiobacteriaceae bacterium TAE3-ERU3]
MRRTINIILSIVLMMIIGLAIVIPSFVQEDYPKAVLSTGLFIRTAGMLAHEYQLKWAKKLSYSGLAIVAVGAVYALFVYL